MSKDYIGIDAHDMGFDAHMTIMFLGHLDAERVKYVVTVLKQVEPTIFFARRKRVSDFGQFTNSVPAVTVEFLDTSMDTFLKYLDERGISSVSNYPWNPHITLKFDHPNTIMIPEHIKLSNVYLKHGETKHYINSL